MAKNFEIRSGRHAVGIRSAATAQQALVDYLRALGCRDDDLVRLGVDTIAWRGARYRAVPVASGEDE